MKLAGAIWVVQEMYGGATAGLGSWLCSRRRSKSLHSSLTELTSANPIALLM
jgi:hypothetical protein